MTMKRLTEIPVIVDLEQSPTELRVHPALFDAIQQHLMQVGITLKPAPGRMLIWATFWSIICDARPRPLLM
jgi:hypothetical protein